MDGIPLFLNEKSYPVRAEARVVASMVKSWLEALVEVRRCAKDIIVGCRVELHNIQLTEDYQTLAALLKGNDRDWWRFILSVEQRSPFGNVPQTVKPSECLHVDPRSSCAGEALLWASANDSFLISFSSADEWKREAVTFDSCECLDGKHVGSIETAIRNISCAEHVRRWSDELKNFSFVPSASAIIYDDGEVLLRMFLNDHNPPHVHVYLNQSDKAAALVRFDKGPEVLRGRDLRGRFLSKVFDLLRVHREVLLHSWERCRAGYRPNVLEDGG